MLASPARAKRCSFLKKSLDSPSNCLPFLLLSSTNLQWPVPFTQGCSNSFNFPSYSGSHQGWLSIICLFVITISPIHFTCCEETLVAHWLSVYSFKFPSLFTNDETIWLLLDKGLWTEATSFASRSRHLRTWCSLIPCHRDLEAICWNGSISQKQCEW